MAKAYILIEVSVGKLQRVSDALRGLPGVETVDPVTGPYDVIAVLTAPDPNAVSDMVTSRVHVIDGVVRTVTCLSWSETA